jgi:Bacterial regulatory proteins, lacI family
MLAKDVATRACTSIATVSYVLNNNKRYLRPELRERVLRAADALGYSKMPPPEESRPSGSQTAPPRRFIAGQSVRFIDEKYRTRSVLR